MIGSAFGIRAEGGRGFPDCQRGRAGAKVGAVEGAFRPWYRSRLFWLGVPGLVFLVWGWWKSGSQMVRFDNGINDSNPALALFFDEGCLMASWVYDSDSEWRLEAEQMGMFQQASNHPNHWLSTRLGYELEQPGYRQYHEFYVPLWLSVAAYLCVWLGLIVSSQGRKARLLKRSAVDLLPDASAPQRGEMK
jgi:hypothetical protein